MNNWTRIDRVLACIRLARRPLSLVEVTELLGDDFSAVSAALSSLYQRGELNRVSKSDSKGRFRYFYTDPFYDAALELVEQVRFAASHDCEEPNYVLTQALEAWDSVVVS